MAVTFSVFDSWFWFNTKTFVQNLVRSNNNTASDTSSIAWKQQQLLVWKSLVRLHCSTIFLFEDKFKFNENFENYIW